MFESFFIKQDEHDQYTPQYTATMLAKLCGVLVVVLMLYMMMQAVSSGMNYLNQYHTSATLNQWYKSEKLPSMQAWGELEDHALSSLVGHEDNVAMLLAVGRMYDFRSVKLAKTKREKLLYGLMSITYYKQVVQIRPVWPYGWMNLALAKARLGQLDDEFEYALMQLLKTGPWEKTTLPSILQLGLFSWATLNGDSKQRLLDYFSIAQEKRTSEVKTVVQGFGRLDLYCRLVAKQGSRAVFCPSSDL